MPSVPLSLNCDDLKFIVGYIYLIWVVVVTFNIEIRNLVTMSVLTSYFYTALEEKEAARAARLFGESKKEEHSKIYKALNPDKLWYESRRQREEEHEDEDLDDNVWHSMI